MNDENFDVLTELLRDSFYNEFVKSPTTRLPLDFDVFNKKYRQLSNINSELPYSFYPFKNSRAFWAVFDDDIADKNSKYMNFVVDNVRYSLIFCDTQKLQELYRDIIIESNTSNSNIRLLSLRSLCVIVSDNALESFPFHQCVGRLSKSLPPATNCEKVPLGEETAFLIFYNIKKLTYSNKDYVCEYEDNLKHFYNLVDNLKETRLEDDIWMYEDRKSLANISKHLNSYDLKPFCYMYAEHEKLIYNAPVFTNKIFNSINKSGDKKWLHTEINKIVRFRKRIGNEPIHNDIPFCNVSHVSKYTVVGYILNDSESSFSLNFPSKNKDIVFKSDPKEIKMCMLIFPQNLEHEVKSFDRNIRFFFRTELLIPFSGPRQLDEMLQAACYFSLYDYIPALRDRSYILMEKSSTGYFRNFKDTLSPESYLIEKEQRGIKFKTNGVYYYFDIKPDTIIYECALVALRDFFNMNQLILKNIDEAKKFFSAFAPPNEDLKRRKISHVYRWGSAEAEDLHWNSTGHGLCELNENNYKLFDHIPKKVSCALFVAKCDMFGNSNFASCGLLCGELPPGAKINVLAEFEADPIVYCNVVDNRLILKIEYFKRTNSQWKRPNLHLTNHTLDFDDNNLEVDVNPAHARYNITPKRKRVKRADRTDKKKRGSVDNMFDCLRREISNEDSDENEEYEEKYDVDEVVDKVNTTTETEYEDQYAYTCTAENFE